MPRWYSSRGRTTEDVGHRHAAHGRDADRPRRLLRLGNRTAAAEPATAEDGADERDGRRDDWPAAAMPLARRQGRPRTSASVRKAPRPSGTVAPSLVLSSARSTSCLPLGRLQQGRRITADGPDRGVVAEQQCRDLPRAGDPSSLRARGVSRTACPGAGQRLGPVHRLPLPGRCTGDASRSRGAAAEASRTSRV